MMSPAALSILTTTFAEGSERNKALGIRGAVAGSGGAVGVLHFEIALYALAGAALVGAVVARLLIEPQPSAAEPAVDEPQVAVASQYTPLCHETTAATG